MNAITSWWTLNDLRKIATSIFFLAAKAGHQPKVQKNRTTCFDSVLLYTCTIVCSTDHSPNTKAVVPEAGDGFHFSSLRVISQDGSLKIGSLIYCIVTWIVPLAFFQEYVKLVGGWAYPSEKYEWKSVGMMTFPTVPTEWKVKKFMFQTTNQ